jgi:hypothetical protein
VLVNEAEGFVTQVAILLYPAIAHVSIAKVYFLSLGGTVLSFHHIHGHDFIYCQCLM